MSRGQKYRKLVLGPIEKITARNSTAGMVVAADYNDPLLKAHVLLLERVTVAKAADTESSKGLTQRQRRKKAVNGSDESQGAGLAFPGESAPTA
jgi:hypothetical protein